MVCATRSPIKYMTSEDMSCVLYGLLCCARPYARKGPTMGWSQSQLGPGIVCAFSATLPAVFGPETCGLRTTFEGWTLMRARSKVPGLLFRGEGAFGMRLKPTRVKAQEGAIMMAVCELS